MTFGALRGTGLGLLLSFAVACGGGSGGTPATSSTGASIGNATSTHAIRVLAKSAGGSTRLMKFGPATDSRFGAASASSPSVSGHSSSLRLQGLTGAAPDAAGVPVVPPPAVDTPAPWDTAWALVWRAAHQCSGTLVSGGHSDTTDLPWQWDDGWTQWFYYSDQAQSEPATCSGRLAIEQNLVCVADRLAELSDAVGMTVWPALAGVAADAGALGFSTGSDAGPTVQSDKYLEWDIPPQADADRFILRDLAIHVIGLLPPIDALTDVKQLPAQIGPSPSCTEAFAWATDLTHLPSLSCTGNTAWTEAMFNVGASATNFPILPPASAPVCDGTGAHNVPVIAESALVLEAQILRGAGRLLHDLIRRDVYSDLAAAAQSSAAPNSPVSGSELAWGVHLPPGQDPYGTISHAARVLMGRWEIGSSTDATNPIPLTLDDPACGGVSELSIITGAALGNTTPTATPPFGPDLDARYDDLPIRTPGEQTASQLVDQAGIVVPPCSIPGGSGGAAGLPGGGTAAALRTALAAQLLLQLQTRNLPAGATPAPNPTETAAFTNLVSGLADAEVVFGFQRSLRTWRLLTNQPDPDCNSRTFDPTVTFPVAGLALAPASTVDPSVTALSGAVLAGGISRTRLTTDTMARAGGMLQVSQCADGVFAAGTLLPSRIGRLASGWTPWGLPSGAGLYLPIQGASTAATLPTVVLQDAFHIGQALERRRVVIDQLALQGSTALATDATSGADPVARGAIAELKSWAGSTLVQAWPTSTSAMTVVVEGMAPSDLGTATLTPSSVQSAFGFVYGPAWVAECAAHVRSDCPANFDAQYVQQATSAIDLGTPGIDVPPLGLTTLKAAGVLSTATYSAYELLVPLGAPNFSPPVPATLGTATPSRVYMVLLHDPASPVGHGRVLGCSRSPARPSSRNSRAARSTASGCARRLSPSSTATS